MVGELVRLAVGLGVSVMVTVAVGDGVKVDVFLITTTGSGVFVGLLGAWVGGQATGFPDRSMQPGARL
jgi:hypothetical protein